MHVAAATRRTYTAAMQLKNSVVGAIAGRPEAERQGLRDTVDAAMAAFEAAPPEGADPAAARAWLGRPVDQSDQSTTAADSTTPAMYSRTPLCTGSTA